MVELNRKIMKADLNFNPFCDQYEKVVTWKRVGFLWWSRHVVNGRLIRRGIISQINKVSSSDW